MVFRCWHGAPRAAFLRWYVYTERNAHIHILYMRLCVVLHAPPVYYVAVHVAAQCARTGCGARCAHCRGFQYSMHCSAWRIAHFVDTFIYVDGAQRAQLHRACYLNCFVCCHPMVPHESLEIHMVWQTHCMTESCNVYSCVVRLLAHLGRPGSNLHNEPFVTLTAEHQHLGRAFYNSGVCSTYVSVVYVSVMS